MAGGYLGEYSFRKRTLRSYARCVSRIDVGPPVSAPLSNTPTYSHVNMLVTYLHIYMHIHRVITHSGAGYLRE